MPILFARSSPLLFWKSPGATTSPPPSPPLLLLDRCRRLPRPQLEEGGRAGGEKGADGKCALRSSALSSPSPRPPLQACEEASRHLHRPHQPQHSFHPARGGSSGPRVLRVSAPPSHCASSLSAPTTHRSSRDEPMPHPHRYLGRLPVDPGECSARRGRTGGPWQSAWRPQRYRRGTYYQPGRLKGAGGPLDLALDFQQELSRTRPPATRERENCPLPPPSAPISRLCPQRTRPRPRPASGVFFSRFQADG